MLAGVPMVTAIGLLVGIRMAHLLPGGALLVEALCILWMGLCMYAGFWHHRTRYRQRYGMQAYRHLFFRFLLPFFVGANIALYFPLLVDGTPLLPRSLAYSLAAYAIVSMQLIELRGTQIVWDFEWRGFVYSVFPERGHIVTAGIFRWLRHPVYSAGMRFSLGLALLRNNWRAVACSLLLCAAMWYWGTVEESDLQRSDARYTGYRTRVPAYFATRPVQFWRFLLTGRD